jgi:tricorn protease
MSYPIWGLRGRVTQEKSVLHKFEMEKQKDHEFLTDIRGYSISPNGKHMLVSKDGGYYIIGTGGPSADLSEGRLTLSHMETEVNYAAEYEQMFYEIWRGERDYFYDRNLHGVDWSAMRDKYAVLLPYVSHRFDLIYLIGEMIGELCCSHTYVGGGDMPEVSGSKIGLLGVDFAIDKNVNRIRIARILEGENYNEDMRSPLRQPGLEVREGDYLLAINGQQLTAGMNPYSLTENTLGQLVTLTVNGRPTMDGAHDIRVKPVRTEDNLRYYSWVQDRHNYVDSASGGKIGYLHIPDMDSFGLYRFAKMFYNQMRRPGLIIDVRWNGGGFVSGLILERLRRVVGAMGMGRYGGPWREPGAAVHAHMVTLQNEFSCSDGDIFPYFFRQYELGPLMGKRTWGGVIGINGFTRLVDGGYYTIPGFGMYNLEGEWVVENVGVEPDVEVDNRPERLVLGYDDQLERAVSNILKRLKENPTTLPEVNGPPAPR